MENQYSECSIFYSILNAWYNKFSNLISNGKIQNAIDYYERSFPPSNTSDLLIEAKEYIVSRLELDLGVVGPPFRAADRVEGQDNSDYLIKTYCLATRILEHSADVVPIP